MLLEPSVVNAATSGECEEAIEAIGNLYSVKEVTIVHGNLLEGTREETNEVGQLIDKERLKEEKKNGLY